jgi:plastocyanin
VQLLVDGVSSGSPITLNAGAGLFTLPILNAGQHTIGANYSGDSSFASGSATTLPVTIAPITPPLSFANIPAEMYGNAAFLISATSASAGALTYSVVSGPATLSGASLTLTGGGTVILSATQAANGNYASANAQATISVARQASISAIKLSSTTVNPGQSVTLSANVSPSIIGSPTGSVTFFDGTTTLGTTLLTGGQAAYTTSTLLSGSHSITASYSGDGNFLTSSASAASTPIVVAPLDFTLATTGNGETIPSGGTASYPIVISPTFGTYPGVVTFTATGGPTGATYSFSPTSVAANAGTLTVTMTVQASTASASIHTDRRIAQFALALLLMPFVGLRTWKRHRFSLSHLLSFGVATLTASLFLFGLSGCGSSKPNSQNFTITMTATSGTVQHTVTVPLTIQ